MNETFSDTVLQARAVTVGYAGTAILKNLDLSFPRGQFTALLGPNGCGKSTLLRGLAGLQPLQAGQVELQGTPIQHVATKALARRIAVLAQSAVAPEGLTVTDLVRQGRYPHRSLLGGWSAKDSAQVEEALHLTGLTDLRRRRLEHLSGGQRQRAWIAMTLAQEGDILLLDEPTSYLDLAHQIEVLALVRDLVDRRGVTVIAVLHDLNQAARYADHMVLLHGGQAGGQIHMRGAPDVVLTPPNIRQVFGVDVTVIPDPETGTPLCIPKQTQTAIAAMPTS